MKQRSTRAAAPIEANSVNPKGGRRTEKLAVIGMGAVGSALCHVLVWFYNDVRKYDIVGDYDWEPVLSTDAAFICVPTPEGKDGRLDCTQITAVLERLSTAGYLGIVVIRSTVRIGFMGEAQAKFRSLRLVYSPEFLRERSRFQWSANPDRLVVSGGQKDVESVVTLFDWMEEGVVLRMNHLDAEIGKLAHNAFIATKVSFTNTIAGIAHSFGADPTNVMSVVWNDRRVLNIAHLDPAGGAYGGKCVPKDTRELISAGGDPPLLVAVESVNSTATKTSVARDSRAAMPSARPRTPSFQK
jgi:UDPglucose 6-dehydrogenase